MGDMECGHFGPQPPGILWNQGTPSTHPQWNVLKSCSVLFEVTVLPTAVFLCLESLIHLEYTQLCLSFSLCIINRLHGQASGEVLVSRAVKDTFKSPGCLFPGV